MDNNLATLENKERSIVTRRRPQYRKTRHSEIHLRSKYQCNHPQRLVQYTTISYIFISGTIRRCADEEAHVHFLSDEKIAFEKLPLKIAPSGDQLAGYFNINVTNCDI